MDEIRSVVLDLKIDIAAFTETWLRNSIQNTVIDIPGYQIYRKDRNGGLHATNRDKFCKDTSIHKQRYISSRFCQY